MPLKHPELYTTVRVPKELLPKVKKVANNKGFTMLRFIKDILQAVVDNPEKWLT